VTQRLLRVLIPLLVFCSILLGRASFAYYSVLDTGDILAPGHYDLSLETEFITSDGSGANVVGRFDTPVADDAQIRALVGGGTTDFHAGAFYKWVPIPDVHDQPAVGIIAGALYARANNPEGNSTNYFTARIAPVASKAFQFEFGKLEPYLSVPIGVRVGDGSQLPIQLALGTEVKTHHLDNIAWRAELGFNLNQAYSYISLNAVLNIDEQKGIEFK
jgi:hypothetical protein